MSVTDGLAPYDAASQVSQNRMIVLKQNYESSLNDACFESLGVPPLRLERPPVPSEQVIGRSLPDFPYLEQLEVDGFPLPRDLVDENYDDGHVVLTEEQQEASEQCIDDPAVAAGRETMARTEPIAAAWYGVLHEVDSLPEIATLRDEFTACAIDAGIAPDHAADEGAFLGAVESAITRLYDDLDALEIELRDLGQIYYRCGAGLFERKIELRLERRDEFLDEHWDSIVELSELLYGEGLASETESASDD